MTETETNTNTNMIEMINHAVRPAPPQTELKSVRYTMPSKMTRMKGIVPLCKSDILQANIQVIRKGGETIPHLHTGMDGFWFVLAGRARFYGAGKELFAECGPREGVFVPRNVPYWFESAGDEPLQLLQVEAIAKGEPNKYVPVGEKQQPNPVDVFNQDGSPYEAPSKA